MILIGVFQGDGERTMATHGVTEDALLIQIHGKMALQQLRQLFNHVAIHIVMLIPGFLGGVYIEACPETNVIGTLGVIRHSFATRTGIRCHYDQTELRGQALKPRLLHKVFIGAG